MNETSVILMPAFILALVLCGCISQGGGGMVTPTPFESPTCPPDCQFGCRPNTLICLDSPLCPENCSFGCEPGTATCAIPCPATCTLGCISGTGQCVAPQSCPETCTLGCEQNSSRCITPTPTPSPTPAPTPSPISSQTACNNDYYCDPVSGENEETCPSDCVPASYCKYSSSGFGNYALICKRYRLTQAGLYLELYYSAATGEQIKMRGFRCTADEHSIETDPITPEFGPGESAIVANGTVPCYNADGTIFQSAPGNFFQGRLVLEYTKGDSPTTFREALNFKTAVRGIR